jgi:tetratricopeptide (TPR) repeat protein/tRNA A-37 threonylcarbamoyl transferase component Bud32
MTMREDLATSAASEAQPTSTAGAPPVSPPGYELIDEIGHGGMGVVYRAHDAGLDRDVAVKLLSERFLADSPAAERFLNEARITGQLQHPGIPAVHQVGSLADGRPFLAMKLIKGSTLEAILKQRPDPSVDRGQTLAIFEAVCQAVGYAHAHRVIHRDLKPANVMVGAFGEVQVMDWGLAKVLGLEAPATTDTLAAEQTHAWTQVSPTPESGSHTQSGSLVGTPAFIPPEQAVGQIERVNERADVFGLGALLAVILTGKPPYAGETAESVRVQAVYGKLDDCYARLDASGAEPELVALCKKCLAFEPADRPADAGTVAAAVAGLRAAADERARRAELDRVKAEGEKAAAQLQAAEQWKRRRVQAALGLAFTALVVLGGAFAWWQERVAREQEAERAVRQSRTAAGVTANLREARERAQEAWGLPQFPGRMQAATDAATAALARADQYAADGDADPETAADLAAARAEVEDLARHTRLITDVSRSQDQLAVEFLSAKHIERIRAAFQRFGFDPCADPEPEIAGRIASSRIRDGLLGALLEMGYHLEHGNAISLRQSPEKDHAARVARATRLHLGGAYARWQELLDRHDVTGLVALSRTPEVLSFGPWVVSRLGTNIRDAGQPQAARELFRAAIARYPQYPWLHFDLMLACGNKQSPSYQEALQHAGAMVALLPDSAGLYTHLARAYLAAGDRERALATCREITQRRPNDPRVHLLVAQFLQAINELDQAITHYLEAIELDPNYTAAQSGLGYAYLPKAAGQAWFGQDKELAATCDQALRFLRDTRDPTTAERVAKICSLRQADDKTHEAALVLARRAVELRKGHPVLDWFQMALGMAEYRSRHYAAADAALLAASQLGNKNYHVSVTTAFYRAMSLFRQGKNEEASKVASEAVTRMKPLPADEKNPLTGGANHDDLILWLAYKEAKALIKFEAAAPPQENNDKK